MPLVFYFFKKNPFSQKSNAEPTSQTLRNHNFAVVSVDVNFNGQRVASSGLDSVVNIWDVQTQKVTTTGGAFFFFFSFVLSFFSSSSSLVKNAPGECYAVRFSPDGSRIATSSKTGSVTEWNAETGAKIRSLDAFGKFGCCVVSEIHHPKPPASDFEKKKRPTHHLALFWPVGLWTVLFQSFPLKKMGSDCTKLMAMPKRCGAWHFRRAPWRL